MNRTATARSTVLMLCPAILIVFAGCASSASRQHAASDTKAPIENQAYEHQARASVQPSVAAKPAARGEFVLGESFDADAIPQYHEPVSRYTLDQIRIELEAMFEEDRELVQAAYGDQPDANTITTIQAIDRAHSDRLKEIVDHIGWPTRDLVGLKATQAAYMVIQHAGHDVAFQNRCLALMVDLVQEGELPASYLALLTDRIRVFQDQPQVFGTQMTMARNDMGVMVPTPTVPIEDPANLNDRRALMGMGPHEQFVDAIHIAYEASLYDPSSAFAEVPTSTD